MKLIYSLIIAVTVFSSCGTKDTESPTGTVSLGTNPDGTPSATAKGEKGDKGDKGDKGEAGSAGSNGSNGKNGTMVSGNQWYDAITDKLWVMTTISTSTVGWNNAQSACGGAYRMPTPSEIMAGLTHGMKACAQALASPPTQIIANDGQTYNVSNGALNNTGSGAQFCIAQ